MTISATDVVAPVLAAAKVIVFFSTGVTAQTCLRGFLRRLILERNYFLRIAFFDVGFARTMARLATRHLLLPTRKLCELGVGSV